MVIVHSPQCLGYELAGHPERPSRVQTVVAALQQARRHEWITPIACTDADILRVHSEAHLLSVRVGDFHDNDTPFFPQIDEIARLAAGAAIAAAGRAWAGAAAFSVMRPPGHHAERDHVMGFCYFNNIAIAVANLMATKKIERVAILDFDCHHGNGTEHIFCGNDRVRFISLHQSPCYPGTGLVSRGNFFNHSLPPGTDPDTFLAAFDVARGQLIEFNPQLVAVSAGFDMYKGDPITQMELEIETFYAVGQRIGALNLPTFAVLEGGYAPELAQCAARFVEGWENQ